MAERGAIRAREATLKRMLQKDFQGARNQGEGVGERGVEKDDILNCFELLFCAFLNGSHMSHTLRK